jgi:hypothetical protein
METPKQKEVLDQIQKVKKYVSQHTGDLSTSVYNAMNGLSLTGIAFRKSGGSPGWASLVKSEDGSRLWTDDQSELLEDVFPVATKQAGGALSPGNLQFKPESDLIKPTDNTTPSLDEMAQIVHNRLAAIDEGNRKLAAAVGPVALVRQMDDPAIGPILPYLPFRLQIPSTLILPFINSILETCRILASNYVYDAPFLRKILSIVLGIFDISRGEWRDGVLSFLGIFGSDIMFMGMIGKASRWVYSFISPDIQGRLESDMWAATKSMMIGYWIWLASVVSPDFVRRSINQMIDDAKMTIEEANQKIGNLEAIAQESAKTIGYSVKFPRVPLDKIPSFDDIQNLQTLLHQPQLYCSTIFRPNLEMARNIPVLQIVFELLNIPITPDAIEKACRGVSPDIMTSIKDKIDSEVVVQPLVDPQTDSQPIVNEEPNEESSLNTTSQITNNQKGGRKNTRRRKQRTSRKTRRRS